MNEEETKVALKEALKEWLDEKFSAFGKYSLAFLGASALTGLVYFILTINGWHK